MKNSGSLVGPHVQKLSGFSLIELLVVMGIIGILLALTVPALDPVTRSTNLTSAGNQIVDRLDFARQTALSRSRPVEVRFYRSDRNTNGYSALRLLLVEEDGSEVSLTKLHRLPQAIIVSADPDQSSALQPQNNSLPAPRLGLEPSALGGEFRNYVAFQFLRDGRANLDVNGPPGKRSWHLTVLPENAAVLAGGLPANFMTLQIDPLTGRVRIFRP